MHRDATGCTRPLHQDPGPTCSTSRSDTWTRAKTGLPPPAQPRIAAVQPSGASRQLGCSSLPNMRGEREFRSRDRLGTRSPASRSLMGMHRLGWLPLPLAMPKAFRPGVGGAFGTGLGRRRRECELHIPDTYGA